MDNPTSYRTKTDELVSKREARKKRWMELFEDFVDRLSPVDHINNILEIANNHIGGRYLEIDYNVPFIDHRFTDKIIDNLNARGWIATKTELGINIKNAEIPAEVRNQLHYSAYSYRRHRINRDGNWKVDFAGKNSEVVFYNLLAMSEFIHVNVFEPLIPINEICRPPNSKGKPMEEYEPDYDEETLNY